jgi:PAS domain S-box-containing protein
MRSQSEDSAGGVAWPDDRGYRLVVERLIGVGMYMIDPDGVVRSWNDGAARLYGYTTEAIVGQNSSIFYPAAAVADGEPKRLLAMAADRGSVNSDGWRIRSDGTRFWANVILEALRDERGAIIGFAKVTRDVTEHSIGDEQRRLIVEAAPNGMIVFDETGTVTMANPRAHRIFGYRPATIVGRGIGDLLASNDLAWHTLFDTWRRFDRGAALSQFCGQREITGLRQDGSAFAADVTFNVTPTSRGPVVVASVADTTARRNSEDALRSANRLMSMAEEMAHYGHWQLDLATRELTYSEEFARIYGLPPSVVPRLDSLASVGEHEPSLTDMLARAERDGEPFLFEGRLTRPDGAHRDIRLAGRGERDVDGTLRALFGILHDITASKDAERERAYSLRFQRAVLPLRLPQLQGCTFDAVYAPGLSELRVGGDWYDAAQLADGRVLVSIGDVCGSGLEAAVVVGVVRQIMRGVAQLQADPVMILDAADRALRLEYPDVYVSAWVGVIDFVERTVSYASAGHPPPLMVCRDGRMRELADPTSMLIGLRAEYRGAINTVPIGSDETLVMYTDGLVEAQHDLLEGQRLLREAAARAIAGGSAHPAQDIKDSVIPTGAADDVAVLVVRIDSRAVEAALRAWHFDVRDRAVVLATRGEIVAALAQRGFGSDECASAEVVFAELIGNVLTHAAATPNVSVTLDLGREHPVLHVLDRGKAFGPPSGLPFDPLADSGRGLYLIDALTLGFTISARPDGGNHARAVLAGGRAARALRAR